jgi:hypothetical protein
MTILLSVAAGLVLGVVATLIFVARTFTGDWPI